MMCVVCVKAHTHILGLRHRRQVGRQSRAGAADLGCFGVVSPVTAEPAGQPASRSSASPRCDRCDRHGDAMTETLCCKNPCCLISPAVLHHDCRLRSFRKTDSRTNRFIIRLGSRHRGRLRVLLVIKCSTLRASLD